jgi:cytochrome c biogenesis protein CcdA
VPVTTYLLLALLLGLRHATDPDHLTAVSTLLLNEERQGTRRAAFLGLAWGLGHATTLSAFGIPLILFSRHLPESAQRAAEVLIGALIVFLAGRLLLRWLRGCFHVHPHSHGTVTHVHPHVHERAHGMHAALADHTHSHAERLGRSPAASFGLGMVHGIGGSAGAGVLLMGAAGSRMDGMLALLVFAAATAGSMTLLSTAFAHALGRGPVRRRLAELVPVLATAGLIFGVWYSLGALQA